MPEQPTKFINKYNMYDSKSEIGKNLFKDETLDDLLDLTCSNQSGISDYWRRNTSSMEASELANILRALNKVAGYIGRNVGQIEWAGMSHNTNGHIILNPDSMMGKYPVPTRKFDYLVGIVVHEGLHQVEWSNYLWEKVHENIPEMKMSEKIIFHKIIYKGEDIYVDSIADKSVLGLYTRMARRVAMEQASRILRKGPISVDALVLHWWQIFLGENISNGNASYEKPLNILIDLGQRLKEIGGLPKGVTSRCELRSQLYIEFWEKIKGLISSFEVFDKSLCWYPEAALQDKKTQQRETRSQPRLSKATIHNIE